MLLYYLLKIMVFIASKVYFRRVWFYNRQRIPPNKRAIFAGNHPSAFLDAIVPTSNLPQVFYFLVRGDIYGNKLVRNLLFAMHTLPIFRFRDGFERMRGNQQTFDRAYRILERGKNPLLLMAEGGNSERKRLLPLRKGAARLAFGAYEATGIEDLVLVPYGVNYTDVQRFRSVAMFSYGEPLYLKDYLEAYRENPRKTVVELTRDLERNMRREMVQIDRDEDEAWANPLLDIAREGEGKTGALEREFARVQCINEMEPAAREACQEALQRYQQLMTSTGLRTFVEKQPKPFVLYGLAYFMGAVPFGLAWLLNAPPLLFTHWLIRKLVPSPVFFPSIRFTAAMFVWLGYWILGCLVVGVLGCLVVGILGFLALPFFEGFAKWRDAWRLRQIDAEKREEIRIAREELLRFLKN